MKNRILLCVGLLLILVSCNKYSLLTEDAQTFCVNGVPATDSKAIIKSLEDMGFVMDSDGIQSNDFTTRWGDFYTHLEAKSLTPEQINKLTGGIFDGLSSISLEDISQRGNFRVFLSWYEGSGKVKTFYFWVDKDFNLPKKDADKVHDRLLDMFGYVKKENKKAYKAKYQNTAGVECFYSGNLRIEIEQNEFDSIISDSMIWDSDTILNSIQQ